MLNLRRANTKGEGAESTVCAGVAVAADHRRAGKSEALLRTNDVNDTLPLVAQAEVGELEILDVLLEGLALCSAVVLLDEVADVLEVFPGGSRHVVIGGDKGVVGTANLAAGVPQALEGLGRGDFVHQVAVNVDDTGTAILFVNDVVFEDFVVQSSGAFNNARHFCECAFSYVPNWLLLCVCALEHSVLFQWMGGRGALAERIG